MCVRKYWNLYKNFVCKNIFSVVVAVILLVAGFVLWGLEELEFKHVLETIKITVTVLISMLGFSVSSYVFLNNTFQTRRTKNELEKQIIDLFQSKKRTALGVSIIYTSIAITAECFVLIFQGELEKSETVKPMICNTNIENIIIIFIICITLINVYRLGYFTYGVINYEEGLKKLARKEISKYKENSYEKISKGEFLNLVNNIEVLVERLIKNHLHAKSSSAYDSNLKRAICDGITDAGKIRTREDLAENYKQIIEYRNLLLQDTSIMDSENVAMGDELKSFRDRLFHDYLQGELLTGINISNIQINEGNLEKTSLSNSFFQNVRFVGKTNLISTDFRNSTINGIDFAEAECDSINFSECKLIAVQFNPQMSLQRANFSNADLSSMGALGPLDKEGDPINFNHANFSYANLTHQDIYNITFDYADLSNVRLIDSKIGASAQKNSNTKFKYANMEKADLLRCAVERCDFTNANLKSAVFTNAIICDVDFSECILNSTNFSECKIENCKFVKSYCTDFTLKGSKLKNLDFSYAIMTSADMSGGIFDGICFDDVVCRNTLWVGSQINNSSFERCVLSNSRFVGSAEKRNRIYKCKFSHTDFSNVAIANIEFVECDFYSADFTRARLINVRFTECENLHTTATDGLWLSELSYGVGQKTTFQKQKDVIWRYENIIGNIEGK